MQSLRSLGLNPSYRAPSSWWEHVPIAHWLVEQLQPGLIVELGSHYGVSFFSFCEAAAAFSEHSFVYAVDSWQGDDHAGAYGEEVFQRVALEQQQQHSQRSRLVRSSFDEAANHFAPQSLDLIHIDGLHTYAAVKHDLETWLPKLKPGGTILFHDINVRERDFGVWQLWEEIKGMAGVQTVEVLNGHGLGIATYTAAAPAWHTQFNEVAPLLTAKGQLLQQLAQLRPDSTFGETDQRPYKQQLHQAQAENKYLREHGLRTAVKRLLRR